MLYMCTLLLNTYIIIDVIIINFTRYTYMDIIIIIIYRDDINQSFSVNKKIVESHKINRKIDFD